MQLEPYLHFSGQCEEAFKFYEKCLGGNNAMMMRYEEAPAGQPVAPEWRKKIMHARMMVGDQVLMGMDAPPERYHKPEGFSLSIGTKNVSEGERIFKALAEGGKVTMPFAETFWAERFGMLVDRFGIPWMVNCEKPAQG
jgi:PhnB protein